MGRMKEWTYTCEQCLRRRTFKFPVSYVPFRKWLLTCIHCRKYERHTLLARVGVRSR